MATHIHICGLYHCMPLPPVRGRRVQTPPQRKYLPQVAMSVHTRIVSFASRTTLKQTYVNPSDIGAIPELRYTFPLYDGVSVVGFHCTVNKTRVIHGVVKEREEAKQTYKAAVARGETAGLLEQLPDASDVFTTTIGNIPAGAEIEIEITYLGELKHDAEVDGIRFTIPTHIAPRYGSYPGELLKSSAVDAKSGIQIVVDAEMPDGSAIKSIQSPSHPISVSIGSTSTCAEGADLSLQKASATLSLGSMELDQDFVLQVVATNTASPVAMLETHPTMPNQRALMATLVPKFNLPSSRPEIVFVCDRSGSMGDGLKIPNVKSALNVFLKSLPLGVKFNICSFGSTHSFLFDRSRSYDAASLEAATQHVATFDANFGGTEMYRPLEDTFKKRYADMDLEVFLLTDGQIWDQDNLINMLNRYVTESKGKIRLFTLGVGQDVSHSLIESVARAGNGFSQSVTEHEKMNNKVVRMLKAALSPHITDYTMEVKYANEPAPDTDDDFEMVEKVMDALSISVTPSEPKSRSDKPTIVKKVISLFDNSANPDVDMEDASLEKTANGKYSHVPSIAVPKILQAPFDIPPLYSFTRTNVYLLFSPEASQKTPKSVILRGTSEFGPLELEIPITVLEEKDETIHQLAARKAVKELEEGRGWLYGAKDATDGKLLKEKHEGRFPDMVEREAVRLGVKFQVGGKWCSFVAVEENGSPDDEKKQLVQAMELEMAEQAEKAKLNHAPKAMAMSSTLAYAPAPITAGAPPRRRMLMRAMASPAPAPPPLAMPCVQSVQFRPASAAMAAYTPPQAQGYGGAAQPTSFLPPPPPPGGAYGAPGAALCAPGMPPPVYDQASAGNALPAPTFAGLAAPSKSKKKSSVFEFRSKRSRPATLQYKEEAASEEAAEEDEDDDLEDFGVMDDLMEIDAKGSNSTQGSLERLVSLQAFSGAWAWSTLLLGVLGLQSAQVEAAAKQHSLVNLVGTELLATALVLAYLDQKLAALRDEWEMMADKAMDWMRTEVQARGTTVEGITSLAKECLGN